MTLYYCIQFLNIPTRVRLALVNCYLQMSEAFKTRIELTTRTPSVRSIAGLALGPTSCRLDL